ncbi:MAG: phosphomannose isomerase type II C-terminal cupin domain [Egibacteraceae bacterium]
MNPDLHANPLEAIIESFRPWGGFRQYTLNQKTTVKILTVLPGEYLSLQYHQHRDELWLILDGGLWVQLDSEKLEPDVGAELYIPRGTHHRLGNSSSSPARVLEIAFGDFDEDDIHRLEDRYGRLP